MTRNSILAERRQLNTGNQIPIVGFGAWLDAGKPINGFFESVLDAGYELIDTAEGYDTERLVGQAIRKSNKPRSHFFVTTKISTGHPSQEAYAAALQASLDRLGLEYVDLFLIHGPTQHTPEGRIQLWKALEDFQKQGKTRAIGVSNYGVTQIGAILDHCTIPPAVNQIELHPWVQQPKIVKFCQEKGIVLQAFSPLSHGKRFQDPTLVRITKNYAGKDPAQVLLRWQLQRGFAFVTYSTSAKRIAGNVEIADFEISEADMQELAKLDLGVEKGTFGSWEPGECE